MTAAGVVLGYDGSDGARLAVRRAGALLPGASAIVVTVWRPVADLAAREPILARLEAALPPARELDALGAAWAADCAQDGCALARAAGFAEAQARPVRSARVSQALLDAAAQSRAVLVVTGRQGHGGVAEALAGSVPRALLAHSDVAVLVVPSGGG